MSAKPTLTTRKVTLDLFGFAAAISSPSVWTYMKNNKPRNVKLADKGGCLIHTDWATGAMMVMTQREAPVDGAF